jgi:hypothetical protein
MHWTKICISKTWYKNVQKKLRRALDVGKLENGNVICICKGIEGTSMRWTEIWVSKIWYKNGQNKLRCALDIGKLDSVNVIYSYLSVRIRAIFELFMVI